MSDQKQTVSLTFDQLKELVGEMRKPAPPTEEEAAAKETEQQMRREAGQNALARLENKRIEQMACSHLRRNGTTTCTYIYNQIGGDYLICQQCQAQIHPEPRPTGKQGKETEHHFYDNGLWNRHAFLAQNPATTTF